MPWKGGIAMFLGLRSVIYDVDNLQKAKDWYRKVLGADPSIDQPESVSFNIGNDRLGLKLGPHFPRENDPGNVAYWAVSDIKAEYKRLIELGATDQGGIRNVEGDLYAATLKDPFGNTLGIGGLAGTPDNRAIEEKPSKTALWTTLMRAFSTGEANKNIRGQDHLAEIFLPEKQRLGLRDMKTRQHQKERYFVIGVYEYVMARTIIFDTFFEQALEQGFEQMVFLGAGYDTRPYRFAALLDSVAIFELDIPLTQEHKQRCLAKADVDIPGQINFVSINFNTESIKDALLSAGFDPGKKTFFIWEGVTYYLGATAVDATLEFVRCNSLAGSAIAFDYIALWPGIFDAYGVKELIEFNRKNQSGESGNSFALEEGAIDSFLSERGFEISDHLNSKEIEENYLTFDDGTLLGHVTGSFRIVRAVTKS